MAKKYICNTDLFIHSPNFDLTLSRGEEGEDVEQVFTKGKIYTEFEIAFKVTTKLGGILFVDDQDDVCVITYSNIKYFEPVECCNCYYDDEKNSLCEEECTNLSKSKSEPI